MSSVGDMGVIPPNLPPSTPLVEKWAGVAPGWLPVHVDQWPEAMRPCIEHARQNPGTLHQWQDTEESQDNTLYRVRWSIGPEPSPSAPLVEEWFMGTWLAVNLADCPANVRANVELARDKPGQQFRCSDTSGNKLYRYQWSVGPSAAPISPAPVPLCPPVAPAPPHAPAGEKIPLERVKELAIQAGVATPDYRVDKWEHRGPLMEDGKGPRWVQVKSWPHRVDDYIKQTIERVGTHTMADGNESYRVTFTTRGPFKHHGPELPHLQAEVLAQEKGEKYPADIGQAHMAQAKPAKPPDGGPAFPLDKPAYASDVQHGMTLRDYFAGQALSAMIRGLQGSRVDEDEGAELVAERSYKVADAMIRERGK